MRVHYKPLLAVDSISVNELSGDYCSPSLEAKGKFESYRCAVSDGSNGIRGSRLWAKFVAEEYCSGKLNWSLLRKRFFDTVSQEDSSLCEQAFAAFIGLYINSSSEGEGGTWEANAMGDCCIFQLRNGELVSSFPLKDKEALLQQPTLVSSKSTINDHWTLSKKATWLPDDLFILTTDGLAGELFDLIAGLKETNCGIECAEFLYSNAIKLACIRRKTDELDSDFGFSYLLVSR